MSLALSDEQLALRDTLRRLLSRESPDLALWTRLCEVGVAGFGIDERYGGHGRGLTEAGITLGELGRTLTPCPLLGSAVLAAQAIQHGANEEARARLLPGIAAGTTIAALAWVGADGRWDPTSTACVATESTVDGQAHYVLDGTAADVLIVAAHTDDGLGLFELDPGAAEITPTPGMDLTRSYATLRFDKAPARRIGDAALAEVRDVACAVLAAEQVGVARRCLELTVEYTMSRVQFGRPIGGFQALKHRMADLYVLVETAESAAMAALRSPDPLAVAVAKTHCSQALTTVAGEMIQLHGGIAITWEHDAHRYFKRAHGSAQLFGSPREHLARISG
jgi:alkylation response protein AidB-like acyl-CoA dehydrogenase